MSISRQAFHGRGLAGVRVRMRFARLCLRFALPALLLVTTAAHCDEPAPVRRPIGIWIGLGAPYLLGASAGVLWQAADWLELNLGVWATIIPETNGLVSSTTMVGGFVRPRIWLGDRHAFLIEAGMGPKYVTASSPASVSQHVPARDYGGGAWNTFGGLGYGYRPSGRNWRLTAVAGAVVSFGAAINDDTLGANCGGLNEPDCLDPRLRFAAFNAVAPYAEFGFSWLF